MKSRRHEEPNIVGHTSTGLEPRDQSPEKFASTDELAWTDDEVRQVCDTVRDLTLIGRAATSPGEMPG